MNNLHKQKVISETHNSTYFSKRHLLALVNLYRPKSSMVWLSKEQVLFMKPSYKTASETTQSLLSYSICETLLKDWQSFIVICNTKKWLSKTNLFACLLHQQNTTIRSCFVSQRIAQLLSRKTLALQVTGSNRLNMDCMGGQSSALKLLLSTFGV